MKLVESAGFYSLSRFISGISLDIPLILAMVERWRRETNTFHLNVGEMTVTLKDVALLLGLPIDGYPVNIVQHTSVFVVCEKFLGKKPPNLYDVSGMAILSWLKERFSHCPEDATVEVIKYHTRAYLFYLVGNTIFSSTTEDRVPVMYLPLFKDFDRCGEYAWGAAALAFLYREFGNASLRSQTKIDGCLTLLQCWCYFYLKIGRTKIYRNPVPDHFPLVCFCKRRQSGTTANQDVFYRKILDSMTECDTKKTLRPDLPDRCLRQLGLTRSIPKDVERWVRKSLLTPNLLANMESEINAAVNLGETQYFEAYDTLNDSQLCDEPEVVTSSAICNADEKVDDSHVCAATPGDTDSHLSTASKKGR